MATTPENISLSPVRGLFAEAEDDRRSTMERAEPKLMYRAVKGEKMAIETLRQVQQESPARLHQLFDKVDAEPEEILRLFELLNLDDDAVIKLKRRLGLPMKKEKVA